VNATDLIKEFGLPIALVLIATYFGIKILWPWITKQVDVAQEQTREANARTRETNAMISGMKDTLVQHTEISRQIVDLLKEIKAGNGGRNRHS
jgi:hypothetical protein